MSQSKQLGLPVISEQETWQRMLKEIRNVCEVKGPCLVSYALEVTGPDLSNALNERNRTEFKMRHLPYFLKNRLSDELPRIIVDACDLSLGEARPLTAADKLARLEEAIGRAGVAGHAILADAYGKRR